MRRRVALASGRLARLATWPWRRAARAVDRWSRGRGHRLPWWPVRRSPHEDKSVVIFAGAHRYEFVPAALGPHRGHVYYGTLRPDAGDLAVRLARMGLPTEAARTLAIVSAFEGGFDAIQTYDRGTFSWGFIQFALTGGLPRLLQELKRMVPTIFAEHFVAAGIDIEDGAIVVRRQGRTFTRRRAHERLHDDPSCWMPFVNASRLSPVQDIQVANAYTYYYAHPLKTILRLGSRDVTLGALFADSEYGRTVVCDRAVNRGVGHTTMLFRDAVRRCGAQTVADAAAILACVREIEAVDGARLDAIAQQFVRDGG